VVIKWQAQIIIARGHHDLNFAVDRNGNCLALEIGMDAPFPSISAAFLTRSLGKSSYSYSDLLAFPICLHLELLYVPLPLTM